MTVGELLGEQLEKRGRFFRDFFAIFQWLRFFEIHKENELCFRVFIFSGPDLGLGEKSNVLHLNFRKLDFRRAIFWISGPPGALGSPPEALEFRVFCCEKST